MPSHICPLLLINISLSAFYYHIYCRYQLGPGKPHALIYPLYCLHVYACQHSSIIHIVDITFSWVISYTTMWLYFFHWPFISHTFFCKYCHYWLIPGTAKGHSGSGRKAWICWSTYISQVTLDPSFWWPFLPSPFDNHVASFFSPYHHHHLSTPLYSIPSHHTIVKNAPCIIFFLTIDYPPSTPPHTILHLRELNPWGYPCCSEFSFVKANWSRWNHNSRQSSTFTVYTDRVDREGN